MKKTLSLILSLLLIFSMSTVAFAAETATALTKEQAKSLAVAHVNYDSEYALGTYAISSTYNHDVEGQKEVYNVKSTLLMASGKTVVYDTVVDKYTGKIYYQKANLLDITSILNKNITIDQAYSIAIDALGLNADNTVALTKTPIVTADGKDAYHLVIVEGFSKQYECTVMKSNGDIENIKYSTYTEPSSGVDSIFSDIIERIIVAIKVLITRFSISNLLDKVSATDLLKIFQFLAQ